MSSSEKAKEKVRERKARRALDRRGMLLKKCAARDRGHVNYGQYRVIRLGRTVKIWEKEWNSLDTVSLWLEMTMEMQNFETKERTTK